MHSLSNPKVAAQVAVDLQCKTLNYKTLIVIINNTSVQSDFFNIPMKQVCIAQNYHVTQYCPFLQH